MRTTLLCLIVLASLASRCNSERSTLETPLGQKAWDFTKTLTDMGPRPPGSAGIERVRTWLEQEVSKQGLALKRDRFTAQTPIGAIEMQNLSYTIPGSSSARRVLLVAHYDSKRFVGFDFVGANDAASSVALLLALTPEIRQRALPFATEVVFVDGEEALVSWSASDSLYGSRRLAEQTAGDKSIAAAFVLDMIGDSDLLLIDESTSDATLRGSLRTVLSEMGAIGLLDSKPTAVQDDHAPLIDAGIPTLHLMDFTFGGSSSPGSYWHTAEDTVDKVSKLSLSIVGEVVLRLLARV